MVLVVFTRALGFLTRGKDSAMKSLLRVTPTRGNITRARWMDRAGTHGYRGSFSMANGSMDTKRVMESGKVFMVTPSLASGTTTNQTGLVNIHGATVIAMKENGNSAFDMVTDVTCSK